VQCGQRSFALTGIARQFNTGAEKCRYDTLHAAQGLEQDLAAAVPGEPDAIAAHARPAAESAG
jgi:hypothetical protein